LAVFSFSLDVYLFPLASFLFFWVVFFFRCHPERSDGSAFRRFARTKSGENESQRNRRTPALRKNKGAKAD
jgi:hypothetical protein